MITTACSRSTVLRARWSAAPLLAFPTFGWAQESPFLTGATALQTNILAWMTPVAIILDHGAGWHGHGESAFLGLVPVRRTGYRDRIRGAADCDLGALAVRRLRAAMAQDFIRTHFGHAVRGCDPATHALGRDLCGTDIQSGVYA